MKIGFIGLWNVGGKLANSLLRNNFDLTVRDLDERLTGPFKNSGAKSENIIIDTSPDLRNQLLKTNVKQIDEVLYTHDHADQL